LPVRGIAKPDTDVLDSGHPVLIVWLNNNTSPAMCGVFL
jgi:hypothetical protein